MTSSAGEANAAVLFETKGPIAVITLNRPEVRNAVDGPTAEHLTECFRRFDRDTSLAGAVLTGNGGVFCAGADLKAFGTKHQNQIAIEGDGPMGPTRLQLQKPVIAAVEGYAVAGGLELALWCDLRVAARDAVFGVFCRRWGVPLIDGGSIRLTRMLGHSHALDLILTGRGVSGEEAQRMGLVNRLVETGSALNAALALAEQIADFPQHCLRNDRLSSYLQWDLPLETALVREAELGLEVLRSGEAQTGAERFTHGAGRHGRFE